ncbi:putative nuclease of the RecB family [Pseudomonas sp. GM33]|uniref:endonuclease NucS domain-containing protein n=1 Tax=Pseudomonas sp. GM33 TaxID=1144329 RepID=UPI0002700B37|nr:endonuclease NucS domain-containing protein [Pseudomonas sp. GM33]EJM34325.1 putative nuclease of the RecB family [Pseudomonas sp. GM33]
MPIKTDVWTVGLVPNKLRQSRLASEQLLEEMIISSPSILSDEWMLIGRQENTGMGGRIDLLAIAPDGALVLIELKRDRTPREVVAQTLDYAAWVESLRGDEIAAIYKRFRPESSLDVDFQARFGRVLDDDDLNKSHQLIIVATVLDASSERIVEYLSKRDIPINVLCFQIFQVGDQQLLSRSWLLDPVQTQVNAVSTSEGHSEPWNGEFYCSFGDSVSRSWADAVEFGFIAGGGGAWYSKTLQLLAPGDRVWVNVPQQGYVGVGRVLGTAAPAKDFTVIQEGVERPVLEVATRAKYHAEFVDDPERCEYFVPIQWLDTVPVSQAVREIGMFGNQNTVCRPSTPKWRWTIERLKQRFPLFEAVAVT